MKYVLILLLAFSLYAGHSMTVHTSTGTTTYALSDVDSITFQESNSGLLKVINRTGIGVINFQVRGESHIVNVNDSLLLDWDELGNVRYSYSIQANQQMFELDPNSPLVEFTEPNTINELNVISKSELKITSHTINGVTVYDTLSISKISLVLNKSKKEQ